MLKIKLFLFKLKNLIIIVKSRILKKKIKSKHKIRKKNFENFIESKSFSQKWFLNNFDIFHHYLPKDYTTNFSYLEIPPLFKWCSITLLTTDEPYSE